MAATTHTHDYLGRELQNPDPGVTDPVLDFLGRDIVNGAGATDFIGRDLITP